MHSSDIDRETEARATARGGVSEPTGGGDPSAAHDAWMDRFFSSYYAHRPVNATFVGVHDCDERLPDLSESGLGDAAADTRELLSTARVSIGASAGEGRERETALTQVRQIDRRLARGFLRIQEWELASAHFARGNPSLYTGEAVFGVMSLFLSDFAPLRVRAEKAVARTEAIPEFLEIARSNVRAAPVLWTERAVRECDGGIAFFTEGVAALTADLRASSAGGLADRLTRTADRAAAAFSAHRAALEAELMLRPVDDVACGAEAFDLLLREGHFIRSGTSEIAGYAEDRLAAAEAYLTEHAADHLARTPAEALGRLANLHPSAKEYHRRYGEVWQEVRRGAEEKGLLTWPDFPIRYVPRPRWARAAAPHLYFLFYRSPAAFGRPPVHDYLVAPLPDGDGDGGDGAKAADVESFLRANNDSVIKLNHVIHHGGLGHHVQNWHAFRADSRIGRMAAVDCSSRIAMLCGGTMAEGWACYATDLAAEAGLLTPLEEYAEAHGRVRMAARAVVDVALHHGEMTLEDAARFYESRGWPPAGARTEAVKNSMYPATALMYLVGTDTIHRLRAEVARRTGSDFDLRHFHDDFLAHGSIPVSLVAEQMLHAAEGVSGTDGRERPQC